MARKLDLNIVAHIKQLLNEKDRLGRKRYTYPMIRRIVYQDTGVEVGTETIARIARGDTWSNTPLEKAMTPDGADASFELMLKKKEELERGTAEQKKGLEYSPAVLEKAKEWIGKD